MVRMVQKIASSKDSNQGPGQADPESFAIRIVDLISAEPRPLAQLGVGVTLFVGSMADPRLQPR